MNGDGRIIVDVLDGHGQVCLRERVRPETDGSFTIGRSHEADVLIDDAYVAGVHAKVSIDADGGISVTDLDTINGIIVGGERHHGAQARVAPGESFRLGRTRLRVRVPGERVAPERADHTSSMTSGHAGLLALTGAVLIGLYVVYATWLGAPRDVASGAVSWLLTAGAVASVWITAWALISRILLGEWRWIRHAAVFLGAAASLLLVINLANVLWFSLNLPRWQSRDILLMMLWGLGALFAHLRLTTHGMARRTAVLVILVPALLMGAGRWVALRAQERDVNHINANEPVFPPQLLLREGTPADRFFDSVRELRAEAESRREATNPEDGADGDQSPDETGIRR